MFEDPLILVFAVEILFLGLICLASGSLKSGYIAVLLGIILLSAWGMIRQEIGATDLFTPENLAAAVLMVILFVAIPFRLLAKEKSHASQPDPEQLTLLQR